MQYILDFVLSDGFVAAMTLIMLFIIRADINQHNQIVTTKINHIMAKISDNK